jgi:hypothetical protein
VAEILSRHDVSQALWRKMLRCILKECPHPVWAWIPVTSESSWDGGIQKREAGLPMDCKLESALAAGSFRSLSFWELVSVRVHVGV